MVDGVPGAQGFPGRRVSRILGVPGAEIGRKELWEAGAEGWSSRDSGVRGAQGFQEVLGAPRAENGGKGL